MSLQYLLPALAGIVGSVIVFWLAKSSGRKTSLPLSLLLSLAIVVPLSLILNPAAIFGIRSDILALIVYLVVFGALGALGAAIIPAIAGRPESSMSAISSSRLVEFVDITSILNKLSWLRRFEFFTIVAIGGTAYGWFLVAVYFLCFPIVIPFRQLSEMYYVLVGFVIPIIMVSAVATFFLVRTMWRNFNASDVAALQRRYWVAAGIVLLCCAYAFVVFAAAPKNFRILTVPETIRALVWVCMTGLIALLAVLPVWLLLSNDEARAKLAVMPSRPTAKAVDLPGADAQRARKYTRWAWAIIFAYPLIRAAVVAANSAGSSGRRMPSDEATIVEGLLQLVQTFESILVVAVVSLLFLRARELRQYSAAALLTADPRSPILWLRSFRDDEPRRSLLTVRDIDLLDYSRETRLLEHFKGFGPFVALGVPGEKVPPLGAARAYASDAEWQDVVMNWLASSQLIVVQAGTSPWLKWELEQILKGGHLPKTMLLMPKLDNLGRQERRQRTAQRIQTVAAVFQGTPWQSSLAEVMQHEGIYGFHFAPDGKLTIVRAGSDYPAGDVIAAKVLHGRIDPSGSAAKSAGG